MENSPETVITVQSTFFRSVTEAKDFLCEIEAICEFMVCSSCERNMNLQIYRARGNETVVYRCSQCLRRTTLYSTCLLKGSHLKCNEILFLIYGYCIDLRNNQLYNLLNLSEKTIIAFKNKINVGVESIFSSTIEKIGGMGRIVQVDEMAFRRGELVSNPTSEADNESETIWIIGGVMEMTCQEIEDGEKSKFFIKIIENRSIISISESFREFILPSSHIKTDGWAAYPSGIRRCNKLYQMQLTHSIVNHSEGFVYSDGAHTNTVENLWSHVRCSWRARPGVNRTRILNL